MYITHERYNDFSWSHGRLVDNAPVKCGYCFTVALGYHPIYRFPPESRNQASPRAAAHESI